MKIIVQHCTYVAWWPLLLYTTVFTAWNTNFIMVAVIFTCICNYICLGWWKSTSGICCSGCSRSKNSCEPEKGSKPTTEQSLLVAQALHVLNSICIMFVFIVHTYVCMFGHNVTFTHRLYQSVCVYSIVLQFTSINKINGNYVQLISFLYINF